MSIQRYIATVSFKQLFHIDTSADVTYWLTSSLTRENGTLCLNEVIKEKNRAAIYDSKQERKANVIMVKFHRTSRKNHCHINKIVSTTNEKNSLTAWQYLSMSI